MNKELIKKIKYMNENVESILDEAFQAWESFSAETKNKYSSWNDETRSKFTDYLVKNNKGKEIFKNEN